MGWYVCVLSQDWLFYKRPGNLGAVLSLAVPRTVLFWTEISDVVPGIYWSRSSNLGVTTPNAPVTTESTLVFLFFLTLLPDLAVCQDVANPAVIQKKTIAFFVPCQPPHCLVGFHWILGTSSGAKVFLYTIPGTWLCFSVYTAFILHPATLYWIVTGVPLASLQLGSCQV